MEKEKLLVLSKPFFVTIFQKSFAADASRCVYRWEMCHVLVLYRMEMLRQSIERKSALVKV